MRLEPLVRLVRLVHLERLEHLGSSFPGSAVPVKGAGISPAPFPFGSPVRCQEALDSSDAYVVPIFRFT